VKGSGGIQREGMEGDMLAFNDLIEVASGRSAVGQIAAVRCGGYFGLR
jgi:hypothetical protein